VLAYRAEGANKQSESARWEYSLTQKVPSQFLLLWISAVSLLPSASILGPSLWRCKKANTPVCDLQTDGESILLSGPDLHAAGDEQGTVRDFGPIFKYHR